MIWTLLCLFLAWGTARLIKANILRTNFNKPTAIILAIVWGVLWVIGGAFLFEYIVGVGTYNKKMLILNIFSASVVSYYALTTKLSKYNIQKNDNVPTTFEPLLNLEPEQVVVKKLSTNNIFQKLFLLKMKARTLLSLILGLVMFIFLLANETFSINAQWLNTYQEFEKSQATAQPPICNKLSNNLDLTTDELMAVPKVDNLSFLIDHTGKVVSCGKNDEFCEAFKSSVLEEIGCLDTEDPGSKFEYWKTNLSIDNLILPSISLGIALFFILLTGHEYMVEKSLGWKRLSIVIGGLFSISGILYIFVIEESISDSELIIGILTSIILIPVITILLMIKGKVLFQWVKSGFAEK
ncbi:MAG: hypothetical protein C0446_14395 [Chitinophaga sp.]|nr:hypothetical protein [Chitinophaga sp.]